jgi:hypothetical protein
MTHPHLDAELFARAQEVLREAAIIRADSERMVAQSKALMEGALAFAETPPPVHREQRKDSFSTQPCLRPGEAILSHTVP